MKKSVSRPVSASRRLEKAVTQVTTIQELLISNEGLDDRLMTVS